MFLSIIIPIYNCEKYLQQCLSSCVKQDIPLSEYEIICVNDGSTDDSMKIVNQFKIDYENVRLINQDNGGVSKARNAGILASRGRYIWFVDSDDFIENNILGIIKKKITECEYDRIKIQSFCFYEELSKKEKELRVNGKLASNYPYKNTQITRTILRKQYIDKYSLRFYEDLIFGEDTYFNYESRIFDHKDLALDVLAYYYRKHSESTTGKLSCEKIQKYIESGFLSLDMLINNYNSGIAYKETKMMIKYWINVILEQCVLLSSFSVKNDFGWNVDIKFRLIHFDLYYLDRVMNRVIQKQDYDFLKRWIDKKKRRKQRNVGFKNIINSIMRLIKHPRRILRSVCNTK